MSAIRFDKVLAERLSGKRAVPIGGIAFGAVHVDARLGGGLARAALHDLYARDGGAGAGFALLLTLIGCDRRPTAWVRTERAARSGGALHAAGVAELGGDPDRLLLVSPSDDRDVLRAADDIVRHGGARAVVIELHGRAPLYDLTASRRLAMGAARSGVLTLVLRLDAEPVPSAAETRWQVASAPSTPLAADAPGHPAFDVTLLRHRGGIAGFEARLEWNRDTRNFAPLSGDPSADAAVRTDAARAA